MNTTILLKQQTPMWHFQADTSYSCLRATEVKPKLDCFLLTKEKPDASWFVKGRTDALDYKLWFVAPAKKPMILQGKYPLFFGNMGEQQKKELIFYKDEIEMHLFSLNDTLIEKIKIHLFEFFANHSFGTRQDKGFGFFFPVEIDGEKGNFNQPFGAHYQFEFRWKDYSSGRNLSYPQCEHKYVETFNAIHYFHKLIRSGINEGKCYHKSLMFFYAKGKGLLWDKPTIRHHFQFYTKVYQSICGQLRHPYAVPVKNKYSKEKIYDVREDMEEEFAKINTQSRLLFRDALGLASEQQWLDYKDTINIAAENNKEFVRFKSPITYRPVIEEGKCRVYIHWDESGLADLKRQSFTISHKAQQRPEVWHKQDTKGSLTGMRVYKDFSLEDYFTFITTYYENLRKQYSLNRISRLGSGDYDNVYIKSIFSLNHVNFRKVMNYNPTKP